MGVFYVYLLHSTKDNGFYIGYSTDLKRRLGDRVKGFASRGCRDRHMGVFYVYLLHSTKDNGFYIGYSTDLKRRLGDRVKGFASRGCRDRHMGVFYVYLLHSTKDNGFYIGYSTDLKRRLGEHARGASFATKSRGPWKLIYYEAYTEREDAEGRAEFLKSGAGRRFLRTQLRHYLERFPARVKGFASRGSNHDVPTPH